MEKQDTNLLDKSIVCHPAAEPTDIVWENRHVTATETYVRKIISCGIMTVFLIGMFYALVLLKAVETTNMFRYP